jgi:hypothetical protein
MSANLDINQALAHALKSVAKAGMAWGRKCDAKALMREYVGLGGGFSMDASKAGGYTWFNYHTGGAIVFDVRGFSSPCKLMPAQYMPIFERIWEDALKAPKAGEQLKMF